jgi:predicted methyltransferase
MKKLINTEKMIKGNESPLCQSDFSGGLRLFQGDAMDLICDLDDHSIDLTILDPDYQDWDKLCEGGLICQAVRVTKLTGNIVCFTKQPFDYKLRNEVNHVFRREIIWSFSNGALG